MIAWLLVLVLLNIMVYIFWEKIKDKKGTCVFSDGSAFLIFTLFVTIADFSTMFSFIF